MPECKFGLNDKLIMDKEGQNPAKAQTDKKNRSVEVCTLSPAQMVGCPRGGCCDGRGLGVLSDAPSVSLITCAHGGCPAPPRSPRRLTTVPSTAACDSASSTPSAQSRSLPPDGEFELMRYRVTDNINLPFKLLPAIQEMDKSHVSIALKASANFSNKLYANNFAVKIPTPPNTAKCKVSVGSGRAKFEADQRAIVWRIKKFVGNSEFTLTADVELMTTSRAKTWSRPPISVEFQVPMFTASGVHVRFLRVYDKSGYQTARWVRYLTKAGARARALSPPAASAASPAHPSRSLTRAPAVARSITKGGQYQLRL